MGVWSDCACHWWVSPLSAETAAVWLKKEQRVPGSGLSRLWNRSLHDWPAFDGWLQQGISTSPVLLWPSKQGWRRVSAGHRSSRIISRGFGKVSCVVYGLSTWAFHELISCFCLLSPFSVQHFINLQLHFLAVAPCGFFVQITTSTSIFESLSNPFKENKHDVILFNQAIH